jgi:YD repeat-containing protein
LAEETYRYRAFISYRHVERDRVWARWLIETLETFRTPSPLVHRGVPPRIGQLFRDDDEIPASGSLTRQIEDALRQSEFLIVVCSPRTPHSAWVRREIEAFQKWGRHEKILVLLTEGEPQESFPPELLRRAHEPAASDGTRTVEWQDAEPIAADVREHPEESERATRQRALLRIAAALLGVSYDDLARREHHRRVLRQRIWIAVAALLLVVAAATAYQYWNYTTVHTRYYSDYGTRWGVPYGIGEITVSTASRRNADYAIDTLRGRIVAMRRENGSHGLMPLSGDGIDGEYWDAGVAEWRFPYPEDRAVEVDVYGQKTPFGRHNRELRIENFTWQADGSAVVAFKNPAGGAATIEGSELRVKASLSGATARKSMLTLYRLLFTREGHVAKRFFLTVWGAESRDAEGRFGRSYAYDSVGRATALRNLDAEGRVLADRRGIAELRRDYGQNGLLKRVEWRDIRGRRVRNAQGYTALEVSSDAAGNPVTSTYLGEDGTPAPRIDTGFTRMVRRFDRRGNRIQESYFDTRGNPVERVDYGVARQTFAYDRNGNVAAQHFFGTDGRPVLRSDVGMASIRSHYNVYGDVVQQDYFGADDKPILRKDRGLARLASAYDGRGNDIEDRYFGVDGKPVLLKLEKVAGSMQRFDQRDNLTEQRYFGVDGRPAIRADAGFWRLSLAYDERGNLIEESYSGTDGKPIARKGLGFARETLKYDDRGNEIEEAYFDTQGVAALRQDTGVARVTAQYDDRGNEVEEAYFGVEGAPVLNLSRGAAKVRFEYDPRGNVIATERYDRRGQLLSKGPPPG